eukprot:Skav226207  [mRNA]  locus=scaffold2208:505216:511968:- [translate_table: standard]
MDTEVGRLNRLNKDVKTSPDVGTALPMELRTVVGSSSDEARIWCASTGKCLHTLQGHTGLLGLVALATPLCEATVLVTGATGRTGSLLYKALKGYQESPVRALVRNLTEVGTAPPVYSFLPAE